MLFYFNGKLKIIFYSNLLGTSVFSFFFYKLQQPSHILHTFVILSVHFFVTFSRLSDMDLQDFTVMWRKGYTHVLLVAIKICRSSLESYGAFSKDLK